MESRRRAVTRGRVAGSAGVTGAPASSPLPGATLVEVASLSRVAPEVAGASLLALGSRDRVRLTSRIEETGEGRLAITATHDRDQQTQNIYISKKVLEVVR